MENSEGRGDPGLIADLHRIVIDLTATLPAEPGSLPGRFVEELAQTSPVSAVIWFRIYRESGELDVQASRGFNDDPDAASKLAEHVREQRSWGSGDHHPFQLHQIRVGKESIPAIAVLPALDAATRRDGLIAVSQRRLQHEELLALDSAARLISFAAIGASGERTLAVMREQDIARLIGLIAHELRTPLTSLRGNIQLAQMAAQTRELERVPGRLQSALGSVDSMTRLVQMLLDVSRIERGSYRFQMFSEDVGNTLHRAVIQAQTVQSDQATTIVFARETPVELDHDRDNLQQALLSLLTTVTPLVEAGSEVNVHLERQDSAVIVDLRYRGRELSSADQLALTRPLYGSSHADSRRNRDALRLELAFVRGVVTCHGGQITIDNTENTNSRLVRLTFPGDEPNA